MPDCTDQKLDFGRVGRRIIEADFAGGDLSSDGGLLLVRQTDQRIGLSKAVASSPTLSRLETRATRAQAIALHGVLIEQFIASFNCARRTGGFVRRPNRQASVCLIGQASKR